MLKGWTVAYLWCLSMKGASANIFGGDETRGHRRPCSHVETLSSRPRRRTTCLRHNHYNRAWHSATMILLYWRINMCLRQDKSYHCSYIWKIWKRTSVCTCLQTSEKCDSLPKYQELTLLPNKTHEDVT